LSSSTDSKIGLALGAGGARGFAHLIVLQKLQELDRTPSVITGSSMGSVIGAAYALTMNTRVVEKMIHHFVRKLSPQIQTLVKRLEGKGSWSDQLDMALKTLTRTSSLEADTLYSMLTEVFGKARFSDTKVPFGVVATDLEKGVTEFIDSGFLVDAVCASSTVPGAFPPVRLGGTQFVDGGVLRVVPVFEAYQLGADRVIGVDVGDRPVQQEFASSLEIISYLNAIKEKRILESDLGGASFRIFFDSLSLPWYRFDQSIEILQKARSHFETYYAKELERFVTDHTPST